MKGTWKEKIGGWNPKNSKRKRQTRKNTLKDEMRILIKRQGKDRKSFDRTWEEGAAVQTCIYENGVQINPKGVIFDVKVRYRKDCRWTKEEYREYSEEWLRVWFTDTGRNPQYHAVVYPHGGGVVEHLGLVELYERTTSPEYVAISEVINAYDVKIDIIKEYKTVEWNLDDTDRFVTKTGDFHNYYLDTVLFVHGRPVWYKQQYYTDYSNKFAKKVGSSKMRKRAKSHLSKGRYEEASYNLKHQGYDWYAW